MNLFVNKMKNVWNKFDKYIVTIIFISFILFISNLFFGYFVNGDSIFHIAHLLAYTKTFNFSDLFGGSILPDLAYGFGYGTRLFYPPLGYNVILVVYSIIHFFGFNIILAIKLSYLLSMILSGVFMYYFTKKVSKNNYIALFSAILYMTFPYHILDIFFRDALSEIFIFSFIPLVFLGIEYLFDNNYKKFYVCFVAGYVFSMISHLVLSVYLTFFVLIYLVLNYKKVFNKKTIFNLIFSGILILIFTSSFIVPMVEHKIFGNYMVFSSNFMFLPEKVQEMTLTFSDMFKLPLPDGNLFFTFSYVAVIVFIIFFIRRPRYVKESKIYRNILILLIVCFFHDYTIISMEKITIYFA